MDDKTFRMLEFDKIRDILSTFAVSPQGKRLCKTLVPSVDKDTIKTLQAQVSEMRTLIERYENIPIYGISEIEDFVKKSEIQNTVLEPTQFLQIKDTLECAYNLKRYFLKYKDICPHIFEISQTIIEFRHIENEIKKAIGPQGEILDSASPELSSIRKKIKSLREHINNTLEKLLRKEDIKFIFQEPLITLRNNRYVLLIRSDSMGYLPGIVHDQSQSKATYFVEPFCIVEENNELNILRKDEQREIIRILFQLTSLIRENAKSILSNIKILSILDLIYAKAKLSIALNASSPRLNTRGEINLIKCRHPILLARYIKDESEENKIKEHWQFDQQGVVPIDILRDPQTKILIITGANAGGKTVALKTLGLFCLMFQAGLHIPVDNDSTLYIFQSIFADIGDEQAIEANLSTFSAHILRINYILQNTNESSLVLLDELGTGTDPVEGSALALAILDFLRSRGNFTVVTTHLNLLKTYAYLYKEAQNASVTFDPVTLKPTYYLVYGTPGISNTLAIAKNLGISDKILDAANMYLRDEDRQAGELIKGLQEMQNSLIEAKKEIEDIKAKAKSYEQNIKQILKILKTKRESLIKGFESKVKKKLREVEEYLTDILSKDIEKENAVTQIKEEVYKVKKRAYSLFPKLSFSSTEINSVQEGQVVRVSSLGKEGIVLDKDDKLKRADILVGNLRVKVPYKDLEQTQKHKVKLKSSFSKSWHGPVVEPVERVNIVGMKVEEAISVVDKAIDHALLGNVKTLEIIHGIGTGRLREAIINYLKEHKFVDNFKSAEPSKGGAGVTLVYIKG